MLKSLYLNSLYWFFFVFLCSFSFKNQDYMGLVVLKLQSLLCALLSRMDAYLRKFNLWFLRLFLFLSISDMSLMAWVGMRISSVFSYFFVCPNSQQGGTAILMSVTIVDSELVPALVHLAIVGYLGLSSTHARNQS